MKVMLVSLLISLSSLCLAQKELQIEYIVTNGVTPDHLFIESSLKANKQSVLYKEVEINEAINPKTGAVVAKMERDLNYNYKDLTSNTIWSLYHEEYIVKEGLNLFNWSFCKETDTILNYKCRTAKAKYMGREYTACFTTEIPFKAAPWKITGLPGVVLKLESTDGFYSLVANNLSIVDSQSQIEIPFKESKAISWEEYVIEYKKKIEENEKQMKAMGIQYGKTYDTSYPNIEILIDKNRENINDYHKRIGLIK